MDGGEWLIHEAHGRWRLEIQDWQAWTFTLLAVTMETSWPEKHQTSTNIKGGPKAFFYTVQVSHLSQEVV